MEQAVEATMNGVATTSFDSTDTDEFGFPVTPTTTTPSGAANPSIGGGRPSIVQRELTEISKKYDRGGKGYLNETEQALRSLDRENKGYLGLDQILMIMDSLQTEQKRSADLIDDIRAEHKRAVSFKRAVIVLSCFVLLLAVANIGTSFVAVQLVKDMKVGSHNDLVTMDGQHVGTTSKVAEFSFDSFSDDMPEDARRRHLAYIRQVACANTPIGYECELKGVINFVKSIEIYQEFCDEWPNPENVCKASSSVDKLLLNCNGVHTTIKGGDYLPPEGPSVGDFGWSFWVFPSLDGAYTVVERVYPANATRTIWNSCLLEYQMTAYCPIDNSECAVFATYDLQQCPDMYPEICGWDEEGSIL